MTRHTKTEFLEVPVEAGPFQYACDRCGLREARRWGTATVGMGERGRRQMRVGLCDPCAASCAAPGGMQSALSGAEHSIAGNGRRG